MSHTTWKRIASVCHILLLLIHVVGGVLLTGFSAAAFGLTAEAFYSLDWVQILRLPIIVCLFAIWLPLLIGMAVARRLFWSKRYRASLVVGLLTPLSSLLLLGLGVMLVLLPLGR